MINRHDILSDDRKCFFLILSERLYFFITILFLDNIIRKIDIIYYILGDFLPFGGLRSLPKWPNA